MTRNDAGTYSSTSVTSSPRLRSERPPQSGQTGAGSWRNELLPRVARERTSVLCRGGMSAGEWHGACAWQDRCWGAAA